MPPIAHLLTWTTYGTWLHGDERGSVDDEHNQMGAPMLPESPGRVRFETAALKHPPATLSAPMREVVRRTIEAHCEFRRWRLRAINVRTNHVHAVVTLGDRDPGAAAGQFKAWSTRRLREAGLIGEHTHVWTKQSSARRIWDDAGLDAAIAYVVEGQGADLRSMEPPAPAGG